MTALERAARKVRVGRVVSDKMDQTVVVTVYTTHRHPLYHKTVKRSEKFYAHDANNDCRVGDEVRIVETRPTSKLKRWRVVDVVTKAKE